MKGFKSRTVGFVFLLIVYAAAAGIGVLVYRALNGSALLRLLLADAAATVFVFLISTLVKNPSVYDPYWSVAPVVILALLMPAHGGWQTGSVLLFACVSYWGIRLTANWAYTFRGLGSCDWRYEMLAKKSGAWFPLVNLFGIMLFPTIVVFLCLLPALDYLASGGLNALTCTGFAVCLLAATLQLVSDLQLHRFQRISSDRARIIRTGLWKYARHPNYLGEILMWWGIYLVMLSVRPAHWFLGAGALVNTLMFLFISIPMAEKRMAGYKEGYAAYRGETNMLLPLPLLRAGKSRGLYEA